MDREAFDGLARLLATSPSRRAALGAALGAGLAGAFGADAKKDRARKRGGGAKSRAGAVSAEATCASPGPSSNLSGCNFDGEDFSGDDLSGSRMVGTTFRNAELVATNLSGSTMKDASFRGADLTCANLRSSTLKTADFRGFALPGDITDLTGANLSSSACGGIQFNGRTRFCRTRMCNGAYNDTGCPGGVPADFCCGDGDCPGLKTCVDRQCVCPVEEAEAECLAGNQRFDLETCSCLPASCVPASCEAGNNACRTCSCAGPDICACLLIACPGGPCNPATGCPRCDPSECEAQNTACQTCRCSGGVFCACSSRACETGVCDPVTGCPPAED